MSTIEKAMSNLNSKGNNQDSDNNEQHERHDGVQFVNEDELQEQETPVNTPEQTSNAAPASQEQQALEAEFKQRKQQQEPAQSATNNPEPSYASVHQTVNNDRIDIHLDLKSLGKKGFITEFVDNRAMVEQYRAIKRKLLNNAFGAISRSLHHPNLIIVSSSHPGEGKTFTAINLAFSIALEQDKTVLLVDSDVLKPSVCREMDIVTEGGLTEYLSGAIDDPAEIIHGTNIQNLKIIPAGKPHHLSTELLASEKMAQLVEELATRYPDRVVIFDAPPLIGINETHIMANLVGQAVVVVEEGVTKTASVKAAVSQLNPELAIGYVLNKSKQANKDQYGYGYYNYGYGHKS